MDEWDGEWELDSESSSTYATGTASEPQAGVWPMISSHGGETEVKGKMERKWESATEDVDGAAARNAVWTRTSFTQALGAPSQCRSPAKIQSRHPFGSIHQGVKMK